MRKTPRVKNILFSLILTLSACSSLEKDNSTPEKAFAYAEEFDKNERYEEAIRLYNEVKNKFPYSHVATKSELAIADVYFKQESFAEAQVSYQLFRELHPKHAQIDYVIFQTGNSFYQQLPDSIDRDLSQAQDAIKSYDELIKLYPESKHVAEAKKNRAKTYQMLSEKEIYVADFYFKRGQYDSAFSRYEFVFKKYPDTPLFNKAVAKAALSAFRQGQVEQAKKLLKAVSDIQNDSDINAALKEIR